MSDDPRDAEIKRIRDVLGSLITWMAQSANSPISVDEARELLARLKEPSA